MDGYIGEIRMFAGNYAPEAWLFCNGQQLQVQQYQALYSIIGNMYGGNNTTLFNLPDFRSRVPVHQGQGNGLSPYKIGQQVGTESVVLLAPQMPAHTHNINAMSLPGSEAEPEGNLIAMSSVGALNFAVGSNTPDSALDSSTVSATGSSQPHPNIQPSLAVSFIICVNGAYPPRP